MGYSVNTWMLSLCVTVGICIGVYTNFDLCINNSLIIKLILFICKFHKYYFLHLIMLNTGEAEPRITDPACCFLIIILCMWSIRM